MGEKARSKPTIYISINFEVKTQISFFLPLNKKGHSIASPLWIQHVEISHLHHSELPCYSQEKSNSIIQFSLLLLLKVGQLNSLTLLDFLAVKKGCPFHTCKSYFYHLSVVTSSPFHRTFSGSMLKVQNKITI